MTRALLVVDVQEDFVEGGSLAVTGGRDVARRITTHLRENPRHYALVVASRDLHKPPPDTNGGHFGDPPDFVDSWPVHCVEGTDGADYAAELVLPPGTVHVRKGYGRPDYSAFQGVTENGESLSDVLRGAGVDELHIVGIATDHCVRASALDALTIRRPDEDVVVHLNLVAGVDRDRSNAAVDAILDAGGTVAVGH